MSCQSLAARAFAEPDKDSAPTCGAFHRSVRFSSESRSSTRDKHDDVKREGSISLTALTATPSSGMMSQSVPSAVPFDLGDTHDDVKREGSISLTALTATPSSGMMSQSVPSTVSFDLGDTPAPAPASCRFPKLEDCAHFHYERVSLGGLSVAVVQKDQADDPPPTDSPGDCEGWICLKVRSHVNSSAEEAEAKTLCGSWTEASDVREWTLTRSAHNLLQLDDMLHRCIYDRKVSGLPNLSEKITPSLLEDEGEYTRLISDYVHHLSIIADDSINCGPVLNWLQMDNKGHKLLVANEDSGWINTPAVAAGYSVRKYVSQARDEISFDVGDMISIIDMPGPQESVWWRGKRGFRVGFFPRHCVAVIGDKVPRHMTQPPPIVGSVAMAPIKPVLRKHGKLISLFRSFILARPSRRSLKQQGILRERVFGCDLGEHLLNCGDDGEHLLNCGDDVPLVLVECASFIEARGAVDGVYRLSGGSGLTQRLRSRFDEGKAPDLQQPPVARDPHAVASLLKMYFRELPNPLCTYQLYESFVSAVQQPDEASKLKAVRDTVVKLPPPHYRTLAYLMRHLRRVSLLSESTGMTARNMAIVWAPNLLRSPRPQHALQGVAVQAVVTEFLICFAEDLFAQEQGADSGPDSLEQYQYCSQDQCEAQVELRGNDSCRRPKSLPLHPPTKLLSLEEARRRGGVAVSTSGHTKSMSTSSSAAGGGSDANSPRLRPQGDVKPKYIEVGSGPNNLPQYHTVLELPLSGAKRGLKRSPSGWRGLFSRGHKQQRPRPARPEPAKHKIEAKAEETCALRPAKSCESLSSDADTLPPLAPLHPMAHSVMPKPLNQHTRSSSCDSYFEPWQAELADMRLRLSPQERDHHMFSEEDDTALQLITNQGDSLCSTPPESGLCSAEPSPRRNLRVDIEAATELAERRRFALEEQLASLSYIDGESPRARAAGAVAEKRHCPAPRPTPQADLAKRLCKDRDSPVSSIADFPSPVGSVKLRERNSPRKLKNTSRYSGLHHPIDNVTINSSSSNSRLSWHGKDGHSTLIKIDWPVENSSVSNLTTSTLNSTPITPVTPNYETLDSDTDDNKHTIKIENSCENCNEEKCLKCELKATDYENIKFDESPIKDISYHNLNRLSAVSTSSTSESDRKQDLKIMTSSHESSSSYESKHDDAYESYNFSRPNYINLQSSSTSKSSPGSPLKSPLKSTISITFRSPTKSKDFDTPTNERDSMYEDVHLEKNLSIVEEATVPDVDASLPTPACQPEFEQDLIILESPTDTSNISDDKEVYNQVKFFKKSIEEVNAMILELPEKEQRHYENVEFGKEYDGINVDTLKICDKNDESNDNGDVFDEIERDNGNIIKSKNLNVRELATRFESPTEQKGPFVFEKFKAEIKYPSLDRKANTETVKTSPKSSNKLSKNSFNARSLDENAFVKEFGHEKVYVDRRKSLEVNKKKIPDLNLNLEVAKPKFESITPTTENKISLIQRFDVKPDLKTLIGFETEKKLSRERIEKYKEERRMFLREKYSSQSFRSSPEQLTRIKIKKDEESIERCERLRDPKFERRNTVDLGQRMRFSLAKSANNLDSIPSPTSPEKVGVDRLTQSGNENLRVGDVDRRVDRDRELRRDGERREGAGRSREERKEKMSPSYNIRDMTAMFEQKSQNSKT